MEERRAIEVLLGVYVATLSVPASALAGGDPAAVTARPAVLVGAGLAVAAVVALLARTVADLADRVATLPVAAATTLPPLSFLPYMLLGTAPGSPAGLLAATGLLGVLPGVGVPVGGAVVRTRRLRERATELAAVTVGDEDDGGGRVAAALALAGVVLVGAGAFVQLGGVDTDTTFVTLVGSLSTLVTVFAGDGETEVAVTDEGLRVDRSVTRWDRLAGYRITDDAVEVVRDAWYLPSREFDREDVDDEAALLDALAEFLPRLDGESVEGVPRR